MGHKLFYDIFDRFHKTIHGQFMLNIILGEPSNIYGASFSTHAKRNNHTTKMGAIIAHVPKEITIHQKRARIRKHTKRQNRTKQISATN